MWLSAGVGGRSTRNTLKFLVAIFFSLPLTFPTFLHLTFHHSLCPYAQRNSAASVLFTLLDPLEPSFRYKPTTRTLLKSCRTAVATAAHAVVMEIPTATPTGMLFAMFYPTSVPPSADVVRLERRPALTSYALRPSSAVTDGPTSGADCSDALSPLFLG